MASPYFTILTDENFEELATLQGDVLSALVVHADDFFVRVLKETFKINLPGNQEMLAALQIDNTNDPAW